MKQIDNEANIWKSILTIVVGFGILSLIFKIDVLLYIGLSVGLICIISPFLAKVIFKFWWQLASFLGKFNSIWLLSLVFYLLLFPISVFYRWFNREQHIFKQAKDSAFKTRNHTYSKEDLQDTW